MDLALALILAFVGFIIILIGYYIKNKTFQNILIWLGCIVIGIGSMGLFMQ